MRLGITAACRGLRRAVRRRWHGWGIVLLYHRVATATSDPHNLCVTPANFAEQMELLARRTVVVPLASMDEAIARSHGTGSVAAITFDDGYADILSQAKPVLERFGLPATAFVATAALGCHRPFWWDELQLLLLDGEPSPLAPLHLDLTARPFVWRPDADQTRPPLHRALWRWLRPLPDPVQQEALAAIATWIGVPRPRNGAGRTLEPEEVVDLARGDLIEIGAHTRTHPLLPAHGVERQREEIAGSKSDLEALTGGPVTSFAYPYGDYGRETLRLVSASGFARACTTIPEPVWGDSDRFRLPRFVVGDWDGATFERRLAKEFGW